MNYQIEIYKELKRKGVNPSAASKADLDSAALAVRTIPEKVRAVSDRLKTHVNVSFLGRVVPLTVLAEREAKCRSCSSYQEGADGLPWCTWCGCSGSDLKAKLQDADQSCPKPDPEWKSFPL